MWTAGLAYQGAPGQEAFEPAIACLAAVSAGRGRIPALVILLVVVVDGTRFLGNDFCLQLRADRTWCNHPADDPTAAD